MNTIELLGAALGFVGSLSLAAAGVLLAKIRRELRSVRQAKADLLSVDTRAEQLEAAGLKTVLQPCGKCEGYGVKGCVRCGDCSGDGYRSRVVSERDSPTAEQFERLNGLFLKSVDREQASLCKLEEARDEREKWKAIANSKGDIEHQYECEREARRAAEKRCEELGAHECWCAPPDGFELVSQTVDESGSRETEFMRTATATYRPAKESSDGAEWKGLKHHLEEVVKDGEKAETAYGFYRYDPSGRWDWTATNNHFQVFSSPNGNADGAFVFPPQTPPMA